ncbi:UDP-glucose 4-epimerase family protein [Pseudomonas mediterranea]|uniref:UDP-glucose 4-epimerase family protein n=1 Tax=Pseudomonas mediterranea TaxID=183795 RepID=UPI0006D8D1DB|nr:SDR family oxidoreductase [Pseudomonas mediterranea]
MLSEKILITGANGFVGSALIRQLSSYPAQQLVALVRRSDVFLPSQAVVSVLPDDGLITSATMEGVNVVVHCAARVHMMNDRSVDALADFRKVNVDFTLDLAHKAAMAGARRFIFISSIKVNGEGTLPGHPYKADDVPAPGDPYGVSKMEAEQGLKRLAEKHGIEIVIIRPVLVYGPGVKANFHSMMKWLSRGIPLPLGSIQNKRSLVSLGNLVDLIIVCLDHNKAANQTFMVSDGEDVSTTELLIRMGKALEKPALLMSVPSFILEAGATLLGRKDVFHRLNGSLQVDIEKTCELLDWHPVESLDEGLKKAAESFKSNII